MQKRPLALLLICLLAGSLAVAFTNRKNPPVKILSASYIPSDNLIFENNSEVSTSNLTYVLVKQWTSTVSGSLRISFDLASEDFEAVASGRIYKNGNPLGTDWSGDGTLYPDFETISEDLGTFDIGDNIQLDIAAGYGDAHARNFQIFGSEEGGPSPVWASVESWTGAVQATAASWSAVDNWAASIQASNGSWGSIENWTATLNATNGAWNSPDNWTASLNATNGAWSSVESWTGTLNGSTSSSPPSKPTLTSPDNNIIVFDNTPTFIWQSSSNTDNYRVEVDNDNNWATLVDNHTTASTTWTTSTIYQDGFYYWRVVAHNAVGENTSDNFRFKVYTTFSTDNLGYDNVGITNELSLYNVIAGSWFATSENCIATGITAYLDTQSGSFPGNVKAAIYKKSDNTLVDNTPETYISTDGWQTFNFVNPVTLSKNENYRFVVWSDGYVGLKYDTITSAGGYKSQTYGSFPSTVSFTSDNREYSIYANVYEIFDAPVLVYPDNNSSLSDNYVRFTWKKVTGYMVDNYRIEVDNDNNWSDGGIDNRILGNNSDYWIGGAYPENYSYQYRVSAIIGTTENKSGTFQFTIARDNLICHQENYQLDNGTFPKLMRNVLADNMGHEYSTSTAGTKVYLYRAIIPLDNGSIRVIQNIASSSVDFVYRMKEVGFGSSYTMGIDMKTRDTTGNEVRTVIENMAQLSGTATGSSYITNVINYLIPAIKFNSNENYLSLDYYCVISGSGTVYLLIDNNTSSFSDQTKSSGWILQSVTSASWSSIDEWTATINAPAKSWTSVDSWTATLNGPRRPSLIYPVNNSIIYDANPTFAWLAIENTETQTLVVDNDNNFVSPHIETVVENNLMESTFSFYATTASGMVDNLDASTYVNAHNSSRGAYSVNPSTISVGQYPDTYIYRGIFYFDTSTIPNGSVIESATLNFYGAGDASDTDFNLVVVGGENVTRPLDAQSYGNLLTATVNQGSLNTSSFTTSDYNSINLNDAGLSSIIKEGTTSFGLRSSKDISSTAPAPFVSEYVSLYCSGSSNLHRPRLDVTFRANYYTVSSENALSLATYYWKVVSHLITGENVASDVSAFTVYPLLNKPTLVTPENNIILGDNKPDFTWSVDGANPVILYNVLVDNDNDFSSPAENSLVSENELKLNNIHTLVGTNVYYYWKVITTYGGLENSSDVFRFKLVNPWVSTGAITNIGNENATFNLTINPYQSGDLARFAYKTNKLVNTEGDPTDWNVSDYQYTIPIDPAITGNWETRTPIYRIADNATSTAYAKAHADAITYGGDDTRAKIKSALISGTNNTVFLYNGTYIIDYQIQTDLMPSGKTFIGENKENTILVSSEIGGASGAIIEPESNTGEWQDILIENFTMIGGGRWSSIESDVLHFLGSTNNLVIKNVNISDTSSVGIYIEANKYISRTANIWIENCNFTNIGQAGLGIVGWLQYGQPLEPDNGRIDNVYVFNNTFSGCGLGAPNAGVPVTPYSIDLWYIKNLIFANNYVTKGAGVAVSFVNDNNVLTQGNKFELNDVHDIGASVNIGSCENFIFLGNKISQLFSIYFYDAGWGLGANNNIYIENNNFYNTFGFDNVIDNSSNVTNLTFSNNVPPHLYYTPWENTTSGSYSKTVDNLYGIENYGVRIIACIGQVENSNAFTENNYVIENDFMATPPVLLYPENNKHIDNSQIITFLWDAPAIPFVTELQVDNDSNFSSPIIDENFAYPELTYTQTLAFGIYYWRVFENDSGTLTYSENRVFTVEANIVPNKPISLLPSTHQTTLSVILSCIDTDNNGDQINVFFYNNITKAWIENVWIENGGTAQITWNGLTWGQTYVFFARGQDSNGAWGDNSDTQSFSIATWNIIEQWSATLNATNGSWSSTDNWTASITGSSGAWLSSDSWTATLNGSAQENWNMVESWTATINATNGSWGATENWTATLNSTNGNWGSPDNWVATINGSQGVWASAESWTATLSGSVGAWSSVDSWSATLNGSTSTENRWGMIETWTATLTGSALPTYTLTMSVVGGHGSLVPSEGAHSGYSSGAVVGVTAIPDNGWSFDNWSGDLSGSTNPTTITMTGDKAVGAHFSLTQTWKHIESWTATITATTPLAVDVSVSPSSKSGETGWNLTYTVTITNAGDNADNYDLTATDTRGWTLSLSDNLLENMDHGDNQAITLTVHLGGSGSDTVTVTATSKTDNSITGNTICAATVTEAGGGGGTPNPTPTTKAPKLGPEVYIAVWFLLVIIGGAVAIRKKVQMPKFYLLTIVTFILLLLALQSMGLISL